MAGDSDTFSVLVNASSSLANYNVVTLASDVTDDGIIQGQEAAGSSTITILDKLADLHFLL